VAVVDAQLSRLDQNVNGVHVVGWGDFENPPYATSPPTLAAEIAAAVGDYPLSDVLDHRRTTVKEFGHLVASLELGVEKKTALALELLDREDWDLFVHTFTEGHCVGHQCWHLHDPDSPSHDPKAAAKIGDPVERVYRALDRGVGTVIERAGDARVLVLSLHGMSSWRGAGMLLDEILYRLDATARPAVERTRRLRKLLYRMRVTDNRVYRRVRARRAGERSRDQEPRDVLGWADVRASRCFTVPTGLAVAGIRLNLVGREPEGILRRGSDADAFCEWLSGELLAIVDERTGTPLVAAIRRTEDIYAGPRLDALPDLLVE
jgi:predicted AlkP superfamily phosphohydrolase/phosphomutase